MDCPPDRFSLYSDYYRFKWRPNKLLCIYIFMIIHRWITRRSGKLCSSIPGQSLLVHPKLVTFRLSSSVGCSFHLRWFLRCFRSDFLGWSWRGRVSQPFWRKLSEGLPLPLWWGRLGDLFPSSGSCSCSTWHSCLSDFHGIRTLCWMSA